MIQITAHGRLVKDPEVSHRNDKSMCNFTVACDFYFGEKKTTFLNCKLFGKRADTFANYMSKGSSVILTGDLDISEYNGKWYTNCLVKDFEFGAKPRQQDDQYHNQDYTQGGDDGDSIPF